MEHGQQQAALLLHAARVVFSVVINIVRKTKTRHERLDATISLLHIEAVHCGAQLQVLAAGEVRVENRLVGEKSDQPFYLYAILERVAAVHEQTPLRGLQDSHQETE